MASQNSNDESIKRTRLLGDITDLITAKMTSSAFLVGVDGIVCSGKTTFRDELADMLQSRSVAVLRASMDDFHNPRSVRFAQGPYSPTGYFHDAFDYDSLLTEFLQPIREAQTSATCRTRIRDYDLDTPVQSFVQIDFPVVVLFEGVFLFRKRLDAYWDLRILLDVAKETSFQRGVARDSYRPGGKQVIQAKYQRRYHPAHDLYIAEARPIQRADIVITQDDPGQPSVRINHAEFASFFTLAPGFSGGETS